MDRRMHNALIVGLVCGILLTLVTLLVSGVANAVYDDMARPPETNGGPSPTPVGHDMEGVFILFSSILANTIGSMLILAAGGAFYVRMSRGALPNSMEAAAWSSVMGALSFVTFIMIAIVCLLGNAAVSTIVNHDISAAFSGPVPRLFTLSILMFPWGFVIAFWGVVSAAIGGFACRALVLRPADRNGYNGH